VWWATNKGSNPPSYE